MPDNISVDEGGMMVEDIEFKSALDGVIATCDNWRSIQVYQCIAILAKEIKSIKQQLIQTELKVQHEEKLRIDKEAISYKARIKHQRHNIIESVEYNGTLFKVTDRVIKAGNNSKNPAKGTIQAISGDGKRAHVKWYNGMKWHSLAELVWAEKRD